jgi:TldD protein
MSSANLDRWEALAQAAVTAALRAGAQYADARLTRTVQHPLSFVDVQRWSETIGVGVRALVNGYWGFAAVPGGDTVAVEQLAREAVAQAKTYARGLPRTVELGAIPPAIGRWTMPIRIDPFAVPFEEKLAAMQYWVDYASQLGLGIDTIRSELHFLRQERVVATSEGSHFTQTVYESGGQIMVATSNRGGLNPPLALEGLTPAGKGWEIVLDADIPEQLRTAKARGDAERVAQASHKPVAVGRYTLVCDGATMASLLERSLGVATQLDRALGYEANASGTSFLNDPLAMLGSFQVASPLVTVTANRTASGQLATVKWDDEGVVAEEFTLVKDGILADYQTTRDQAAWLAPYYREHGRAVQSHGCAAADSALRIPMQMMPNLALAPHATKATLEDLIANVTSGILMTEGQATADFQARTGTVRGTMQEIKNGRLGRRLTAGAVLYDTLDFWKHVTAVGGASTQMTTASSGYPFPPEAARILGAYPVKGEPPQRLSCSIQSVAAMIANQSVVNPLRKA